MDDIQNWGGILMKRNKKTLITFLSVVLLLVGATSALAASYSLENGKLYYEGGQTDNSVYSHIWDTNTGDQYKYMVKASVKVCGSITTSGFVQDEAFAGAKRSFWCNETSYYDYYQR